MKYLDSFVNRWIFRVSSHWLVATAVFLTLSQCVLAFFYQGPDSVLWEWLGWICLWSAGVFGMLPILTFRKYGGVPQGESYIRTTRLVTRGIYAIVRHPQNGTSWILINLGIFLIIRHWSSYLLGGTSMILVYLDTYLADQRCIRKFGENYRAYMARVPRINFLYGILKLIRQRWTNTKS